MRITMVSQDNLSKIIVLCLWLIAVATTTTTPSDAQVIKSECQQTCGNVSIPYPFGTTEGCYLNKNYLVTCNETLSPPSLFLWKTNIEVLEILISGELRVLLFIAKKCYNGTHHTGFNAQTTLTKFPFSSTRNKFIAIGCDTYAFISGNGKQNVTIGCLSMCQNVESVATDGSCSGRGCYQTSIPKEVLNYTVTINSLNQHIGILDFNPCSYSFLAEENSFQFNKDYLSSFNKTHFPVILDWAIGTQTCLAAKTNIATYACQAPDSTCYDSDNGPGYRCNCTKGYEGNPYLLDGCKDINECDLGVDNCLSGYCYNTPGSFECRCPDGHHGNGTVKEGCVADQAKDRSKLVIIIAVGINVGVIALIMCGYCLYLGSKRRKLIELKNKFFQQNGGLMLQQQISTREGYSETAKIFSAEELEKATNMYDESRVIGRGGYGTVYKGILAPDNKVVAIKKSKLVDNSQIEQFINEVVVLSQVNHRNVVKLLGCCLETEVPLLVYEFVSHGTLHEHIHEERSPMSWETRLRIGTETAGVLAYLHSSASIPIIHRDVKSTNILLDESYIAKVSDFGASRLVPFDQAELSTMVQGTIGYLDPEYLQTSQLTDKSDVYSFGVVLVELLTGRQPLCFDMPEKERCLANFFLASLKEDRLFQILEETVSKEANAEQVKGVANIAKMCLRVSGDERPTMKEVAMELEAIKVMGNRKHSWANNDEMQEKEYLLGNGDEISSYNMGNGSSVQNSLAYDSIKHHVVLTVGDGR